MGFDTNVLVFCPTSRIEPETVRAIFEQDYAGAFDVLFSRDNPYGHDDLDDDYHNILFNLKKMRKAALDGDYDAVWIVESDIIPPADALRKLMAVDGDTVGGLYALRSGTPQANLFPSGAEAGVGKWMPWERVAEHWGQVIETAGTCTGCLLVRRTILDEFDFRRALPCAPDVGLMQDLYFARKRQMCDLSVVCGHKRPDGMILWPVRGGVEYERVEPSFWETR